MLLVVALAIMAQVPFSLGAIPLSNKTEYAFNLSSADSSTGNPKLRYNNCGSGFCDTSFSSCCWNSNPKVVSAPKCYDGCFNCPSGTCSDSFYQCVWIESCPAQMYMTAPEDRSWGLCTNCTIPSAYTQLFAMKSKCIQPTSNDNGAKIILSTCFGSKAQNWTFQRVDMHYVIVNQESGKCLNVPGESKTAGVQLIQWTCWPYYNNALWTVQSIGAKGAMRITNVNSGLNLDVYNGLTADGTKIMQNTPNGKSSQVFLFPSCPTDKYLAGCGGGSPGKCTHCSTKKCPAGRYRKGCGGTSWGRCAACSTTCPAGKYLKGCKGTSAGKCAHCSTKKCPAGMYLKGCSGTSAGKCVRGDARKP